MIKTNCKVQVLIPCPKSPYVQTVQTEYKNPRLGSGLTKKLQAFSNALIMNMGAEVSKKNTTVLSMWWAMAWSQVPAAISGGVYTWPPRHLDEGDEQEALQEHGDGRLSLDWCPFFRLGQHLEAH